MGNSNTKESRAGDNLDAPADLSRSDLRDSGRPRNRMSRGDLGGFLSLQTPRDRARDRQDAPFEHRETRQEREARRLEKERIARAKERERSIREEHVDGGYLVTMGTYTGTEDFSKPVVRHLQIERKLAPFWRGLNDWSENWAEHQLVAAARGLPIPAADAPPDPDLMPRPLPRADSSNAQTFQNLMVPLGPRTLSAASDRSGSGTASGIPSPITASAPRSSSIKPRAKALAAALSGGSRNASSTDLTPRETNLPLDPFVNGQPMEVYLYKDASECPICFLSYPPYLNRTRCCDQPICSECFVQIKRADPHLPEHHPNGEARDPNDRLTPNDPPEMLISEPSACPYCQQQEFGVTYDAPPFRRGLVFSSLAPNPASSTAMSSESSLNSTLSPAIPPPPSRRRTHSLSATAPNVITTDRVRPDWAIKLASARAHQARRAAAATALHTAAFLVGGQENRSILRPGRFGRRGTGSSIAGGEHAGNLFPQGGVDPDAGEGGNGNRAADGVRRSRMEELEDMMFMEAVRLSLAAEEERKRKEEKVTRKEAKKRQQAEKKAQKKASKDPYGDGLSGASGSSLSLGLGLGRRRGNSGASGLRAEPHMSAGGAPQSAHEEEAFTKAVTDSDHRDEATGKGKGVDRGAQEAPTAGCSATTGAVPIPVGSGRTSSHLRQMSNASSVGSSLADTPSESFAGAGLAGQEGAAVSQSDAERDTGSEPLFNFRSLAELVGVDIDGTGYQGEGGEGTSSHAKDAVGRPLSQVKEEEKEGTEAEHVEQTETKYHPELTIPRRESTLVDGGASNGFSPKVTLTPGTPLPDEDVAEAGAKQSGHSRITEHASELSR